MNVDNKKQNYKQVINKSFRPTSTEQLPTLKAIFPNSMTIFILICFVFIKVIQEAFFTELPKTAYYYFKHSSQEVGWYLLVSIVYALPVSLLSAWLAKVYPDRYLLFAGFLIYISGTIIKINYSFDQYMSLSQFYIGSSIIFAGSLITEAAAVSILNKVISPTLKRGLLNAGLMSGTGDTIGRAIGNSSYTIINELLSISLYLFTWYLLATGILAILIALNVLFMPILQKYSIIRVFRSE